MNNITHAGRIESISDDCLHVRIQQSSACAECKVAGHCNASESKDKIIDVYGENTSAYEVGQSVTITTDSQVGYMAVIYAYVLPLVLMLGSLFIAFAFCDNELTAALISLAVLLPYYLVLWLLRGRISRQVAFRIEKINI